MKTQTEVQIQLNTLESYGDLHVSPEGYIIKIFMGCSEVYSRTIKIGSSHSSLNQKLKIKNILGDQLELWLCDIQDEIIANAAVPLIKEGEEQTDIELKLNNILFAKLNCSLSVTKRPIEKLLHVEPDEQLLKKQEDPQVQQVRQEEEKRRLKETEEQEKLAQKERKHAITKTYGNKKDEPFV